MKHLFSFAIMLFVVACNSKSTNPSNPTPSATPGNTSPSNEQKDGGTPKVSEPNQQNGLGADAIFALFEPPHPYGKTNMDVRPLILINATKQTTLERCKLVKNNSFFVDESGNKIETNVEPSTSKETNSTLFAITPVQNLKEDKFYWLKINSSNKEELTIRQLSKEQGIIDKTNLEYGFFVGSSPRLLSAHLTAKNAPSIFLIFSEPVAFSSIVGELEIWSAGASIPICLAGPDGCLTKDQATGMSETMSLQVEPSFGEGVKVRLKSGFTGSGRSVAETAKFSPENEKSGTLEYSITWAETPEGKEWTLPIPPAPNLPQRRKAWALALAPARGSDEAMIDVDALVVGAGPVGLVAAAELRRRGLTVRIIDQAPAPTAYSKAQVLHPRTLELLDNMGVAGRFVEKGRWVQGVSMFTREAKRFAHLVFHGVDSPYDHILSLPQRDTELLLADHLRWRGVSVERNASLVELAQGDDHVATTVERATGEREVIRAAWVVGCDGARSDTRRLLATPFEGEGHELRILQADLRVSWGAHLPDDELLVFLSDHGVLGAFPLPGEDRYRVVLPLDLDEPHEPTLDAFQRLLAERGPPGAVAQDPAWMVDFRIRRRLARGYRSGRVFLAGDAAHLHSPAGGQGMNSGIQDAFNLAWKLALVHRGAAPASLLDSYEAERRPVAEAALAGADQAADRGLAVAASRSPLFASLQAHSLGFLAGLHVVQHRVSRLITMLEIGYPESPIVAQDRPSLWSTSVTSSGHSENPSVRDWIDFGHGPPPGARAPDALIHPQNNARLFDLLRDPRHTLLLFDGAAATEDGYHNLDAIAGWVQERLGDHVQVCIVLPRPARPGALRWGGAFLFDTEGELHRRYGVRSEALYLIRPDGHVAYRAQPASLERLRAYLARVFLAAG